MKIRSITVFCEPGYPVNRLLLQQVGIFATMVTLRWTMIFL